MSLRVQVDQVLRSCLRQSTDMTHAPAVQTVEALPNVILALAEDGTIVGVEVLVPGMFSEYPELFSATLSDG